MDLQNYLEVHYLTLTYQVMEHSVLGVIFWNGVLPIKYSQLCRVFKRVLHKTEKE